MNPKEKTVPFTIRLSESTKKKLEKIAEKESRSVNNVVGLAIAAYLRRYKDS